MKTFTLTKFLMLSAFAGIAFTSCSNNDGDEENGVPGNLTGISFNLEKTAEVQCSSNDIKLGEKEWWYQKLQDFENGGQSWIESSHAAYWQFKAYAPSKNNGSESVSQDEYNFVMQYLKDHPNEGSTDFEHYNYFIQLVGKSGAKYYTKGRNNANHEIVGSNHMDYLEICDQNGKWEHVNDYNGTAGPRALVLNHKITGARYHESWGNNTYAYYKFYTIEYNGKKSMYLCFDYATHKDSGEDVQPDGIYDDWVIKVIPCCDIDDNGGKVDPDPTPDPVDPVDPVDPKPDPDPDPTPTPTPTPTPDKPSYDNKGMVEVNLSAQDHKDEECSKLSIHVRDTCNFKVFIPVPATAYCEADDMYIVEKHYENMSYNKLATTMEREIEGQKVTLTVKYEANGIYIESTGINAKVLEHCRNVYGDGITFEINNYYNIKKLTREALIELLNKTTIEFTDNQPYDYVNTIIGTNKDSKGNLLDCKVTAPNWTKPAKEDKK